MSLLETCVLIGSVYVTIGRVGSIATCLLLGISAWETLIIALSIDLLQLPAYGLAIEATYRYMPVPKKLQKWVQDRSQRTQEKLEKKTYLKHLARYRPLAVMAVSAFPFKGFGVLSACIVSFILGLSRLASTLSIMSGSLVSSVIAIAIFFMPARWIIGS
jgi:uncharacterized membrane protein